MKKKNSPLLAAPLMAAPLMAAPLMIAGLAALSSQVSAQTFSAGNVSGYLNLELGYGLRIRTEDQDKDLLGPGNAEGGTFHLNSDDGNLNYDKGDVVANVLFLKPEFAVQWGQLGFFARGYGFYDFENSDNSRHHVPLSDMAKDDVAHNADLQEAYLSLEFMTGQMPTRLRVGKQVLNWGQANFFSGVSSVNPINIPQLQMPGGGSSDLEQGQGMAWGLVALTPLISVEGFYVYDWEASELTSSGAFLASYDNLEGADSYGGVNSFLAGEANDTGASDTLAVAGLVVPDGACDAMNGGRGPRNFTCETEAFTAVPGGRADRPDEDHGDWGLSIRTVIPQLNDTEFAFHYARYTSHFPIAGVQLGDFPALAETGFVDPQFGDPMPVPYTPEGIDQIARELLVNDLCTRQECNTAASAMALHWALRTAELQPYYPYDRIEMFGLSWATTTIATGTALAGELVHNQDMPLQVHSGEILWGAVNPTVSSPECNVGRTVSIGPIPVPCAPAELRTGPQDNLMINLDTSQLTLSATQLFPPGLLGSDSWTAGLEASWIHLHKMPDAAPDLSFCVTRPDQRPGRDEIATLTVTGTRIFQCDESSYAYLTDDSWGIRAFVVANWTGVFGELSITPRLLYKNDVEGYSPNGQLIEGREEVSVGVSTSFLRRASVDLSYRAIWGGGTNNLLKDRDYMDLVIKYEF